MNNVSSAFNRKEESSHRWTEVKSQFSSNPEKNVQVKDLIAQLKVGDLIEGKLIQLVEGHYMLAISEKLMLEVSLSKHPVGLTMPTHFEVLGVEEGKLYLGISEPGQEELIDKIFKSFELPKTETMKHLVARFIRESLPLKKETLLKCHHMQQTYNISEEALLNLIKKDVPFTIHEIEQLAHLREGKLMKCIDDLSQLIIEVEEQEVLLQTAEKLEHFIGKESCRKMMRTFFNKESVTSKTHHLSYEKINSGSLNDWVSEFAGDKENKHLLKSLVKHMIDCQLKVDLKQLDLQKKDEFTKFYTTQKVLDTCIKIAKETLSNNELQGQLNEIAEEIKTLDKFNVEAQYYLIPLTHKEKDLVGELYFFEPKGKKKKNQESLYVVLAVTFPAIERLEIHIQKVEKNIAITFKVCDEKIQNYFEQVLEVFKEKLLSLPITISSIQVSLLSEMGSKQTLSEITSLNRMDLKI